MKDLFVYKAQAAAFKLLELDMDAGFVFQLSVCSGIKHKPRLSLKYRPAAVLGAGLYLSIYATANRKSELI